MSSDEGLRSNGDDGVDGGDYVRLGDDCGVSSPAVEEVVILVGSPGCCNGKWGEVLRCWVKMILLFLGLGLLAVAFLKWVTPFFMDKIVVPLLNWETATFSRPVLAVFVVASLSLFPILLLPTSPSMWVAGMTFGYGYGFLLTFPAIAVGVSLPYFIGSLFYHKIQGWLENYPKRASMLRSAGEGNWFHQLKAVTLIRLSPFPYIFYNYCSVATNVRFGPYLLGSLLGTTPDIFVSLYTGIMIRALANASSKHHDLSAPQIALDVIGFCVTVAVTIICATYAKRRLNVLQTDDEPLLQ